MWYVWHSVKAEQSSDPQSLIEYHVGDKVYIGHGIIRDPKNTQIAWPDLTIVGSFQDDQFPAHLPRYKPSGIKSLPL